MEVPGVDHDPAGAGVVDEDADLVVVGLGLGERVVQHDVDVVLDRLVGVDLGDHDPVAVLIEHVRQTDQHDVVVVDQRDRDRTVRRRGGHEQARGRQRDNPVVNTRRSGMYSRPRWGGSAWSPRAHDMRMSAWPKEASSMPSNERSRLHDPRRRRRGRRLLVGEIDAATAPKLRRCLEHDTAASACSTWSR